MVAAGFKEGDNMAVLARGKGGGGGRGTEGAEEIGDIIKTGEEIFQESKQARHPPRVASTKTNGEANGVREEEPEATTGRDIENNALEGDKILTAEREANDDGDLGIVDESKVGQGIQAEDAVGVVNGGAIGDVASGDDNGVVLGGGDIMIVKSEEGRAPGRGANRRTTGESDAPRVDLCRQERE